MTAKTVVPQNANSREIHIGLPGARDSPESKIGAGLVDATVHQEDHHELTADLPGPGRRHWPGRCHGYQEDHHELTAGVLRPTAAGIGLVDATVTRKTTTS